MADLTPVERSVLVALMAAGGTLRESADLAGQYEIRMSPAHRRKLSELGLVKTTKGPFTHTLTDKGWGFLASDFPLDIPREAMKLGGMNALVAGVQRACSAQDVSLADFFAGKALAPPPPPPPAENKDDESDLSKAAWSDSEEAIAIALQDMAAFGSRIARLEKTLPDDSKNDLKQVSLNADSVFQNVRLAARKRGLETLFERGAEIAFDPVRFDCFEELDEGEPSIVIKQPVIKHTARDGEIIVLRGLASPAD